MPAPAQPGRKTQRDRILGLLVDARGGEVPAYELAKVALQYSARVKELRELGFIIRNRTQRVNGQVHGYFRLVTGPALANGIGQPNASPIRKAYETDTKPVANVLATMPDSLFGDLAPDRSYRE